MISFNVIGDAVVLPCSVSVLTRAGMQCLS